MFEKNLKYYRLKSGMNKKQLSEACGLTPMAISNYESGKRKPDMDTINRLAEVLGVHVVDFLASRNTGLVFTHKDFNKSPSLTKEQQEYVKESVEDYFSRFFDSVECLGGNPLSDIPCCNSLQRSESYEDSADNLRASLKLQKEGPIYDLVGILENKGFLICELDIENRFFSGINGFVNDYPYIAINKNMKDEQKRFTIAHELAHLMFKWDEGNHEHNEWEASAIAGAFLITKNDLIRELGVRRSSITKDMIMVCEEYGISMFILVRRASQIRIIPGSAESGFYTWTIQSGWKDNEPSRIRKKEEPRLFRQLVFRAVNEEGVSIQRGAELLRIPVAEMRAFCGSISQQ